MSNRAAIYTRISKHNDRVPKVEEQEAMCRDLAKKRGYEIVKVYADDGISASKFKDRPGWSQMLADVNESRFDVLIAQSDDRFTRQPMEKETLTLASIAGGVQWLTVHEGLIDPATSDGAFKSGLSTLLARQETMKKAERQKNSNRARLLSGQPLNGGERPFGYLEDKLTIHPVEGPLVVKAYEDFLAGTTMSAIRTRWNHDEVRTVRGNQWDVAKVEKLLRRPRNAGYVQHEGVMLTDDEGEPIRGQQEPLIDVDTYMGALARLNDPSRKSTKVYEPRWLMTGIARCGACGTVMRSSTATKEKIYRCGVHSGTGLKKPGVRHVSMRCSVLDPVVEEAVVSALLMAPGDDIGDPDSEALSGLHVRLGDHQAKKERLVEAVSEGLLKPGDIRTQMSKIDSEIEDVERVIADIKQRNARAALISEAKQSLWSGGSPSFSEAAKVKGEIRDRFRALDLEQRRALVRSLVEVTIHSGRSNDRVQIVHLVATSLNEDAA